MTLPPPRPIQPSRSSLDHRSISDTLGSIAPTSLFDDVRVRQAIAMAIDKETLVKALYPPAAQVATQFVPPDILAGRRT